MLKELFGVVGDVVGTVAGIAIAPIAIALGVSRTVVERAIRAGCKTEREIREWVKENT